MPINKEHRREAKREYDKWRRSTPEGREYERETKRKWRARQREDKMRTRGAGIALAGSEGPTGPATGDHGQGGGQGSAASTSSRRRS